jgi:predicted secreted hydrolase
MGKRRTTLIRATIGATALAGAAVLAAPAMAQAGTGSAGSASAPASVSVHLPADQAAHAGAANEWWFVVGHLQSHGHLFGYEVQLIAQTNALGGSPTPPETEIAITDQTTGQYYTHTSVYDPRQTSFSTTTLDENEPTVSLSGPMNAMHLHATMPAGTIDVTLDALGPVLYNYGTGLMPYLGGSSYYYSLPSAATTGTLVENGQSYPVTGQSWVDHQWGSWDWSTLQKYTWMSFQLSTATASTCSIASPAAPRIRSPLCCTRAEPSKSSPWTRWPPEPRTSGQVPALDSASALSGRCTSPASMPA